MKLFKYLFVTACMTNSACVFASEAFNRQWAQEAQISYIKAAEVEASLQRLELVPAGLITLGSAAGLVHGIVGSHPTLTVLGGLGLATGAVTLANQYPMVEKAQNKKVILEQELDVLIKPKQSTTVQRSGYLAHD